MVEARKIQKEVSPEQGRSRRSRVGVIAEISEKDNTQSKNESKGKEKFEAKNPRKLKNSGKPKGHAINALNQHAPRGHIAYCAAIMH